tara:strand:+ start:293 stop:913 length:621 start_codon:yes stop_codon:yes gene_type:complete
MALTYGHLLLGKHKQEDLKAIQEQARAEQKKARKRGLWSSIGGTLGTWAAPALMSALGVTTGPAGLLAAKMAMGRLGRELGEKTAGPKASKEAIRKAGDHGFHKELRGDYIAGLEDAQESLDRQQWIQSVANPLQSYVADVGLENVNTQLKDFGQNVGEKAIEFKDRMTAMPSFNFEDLMNQITQYDTGNWDAPMPYKSGGKINAR